MQEERWKKKILRKQTCDLNDSKQNTPQIWKCYLGSWDSPGWVTLAGWALSLPDLECVDSTQVQKEASGGTRSAHVTHHAWNS